MLTVPSPPTTGKGAEGGRATGTEQLTGTGPESELGGEEVEGGTIEAGTGWGITGGDVEETVRTGVMTTAGWEAGTVEGITG